MSAARLGLRLSQNRARAAQHVWRNILQRSRVENPGAYRVRTRVVTRAWTAAASMAVS